MPKLKPGELRVTIDFQTVAQNLKVIRSFVDRLSDQLDIAAIQQGMKERDRRVGERRRKAVKSDKGEWP